MDASTDGAADASTDGAADASTDGAADGDAAADGGCNATPDEDKDGDGWSINQGDCNDCNPLVNPGAIEVTGVTPAIDDNCDGLIDNIPPPCDDNVALDTTDPVEAAKALEICKVAATSKDWGLVSAKWVLPDGTPPPANPNYDLGHGVLPGFGPNVSPRAGQKLLVLSSGTARQPTDPGYQNVSGFDKGYTSGSPPGFPKESPACPGVTTGQPHDGVALEVTLRVPTNAQGFRFDFDFYTYEWPSWVCSQYNDFFVANLSPIPMGQTDGNISFDSVGNPVSVNNAFLEVCGCTGGPPCTAGGKTFTCPLGDSELQGTGFGMDTAGTDHGATSWLTTQAPAAPGTEITLRFAVYDSGDGLLDSTALVDNFQWEANGTTVSTTR